MTEEEREIYMTNLNHMLAEHQYRLVLRRLERVTDPDTIAMLHRRAAHLLIEMNETDTERRIRLATSPPYRSPNHGKKPRIAAPPPDSECNTAAAARRMERAAKQRLRDAAAEERRQAKKARLAAAPAKLPPLPY